MSEKRIIRRRRAGSAGSDSEEEEGVVLSGASDDEGVSASGSMRKIKTTVDNAYRWMMLGLGFKRFRDDNPISTIKVSNTVIWRDIFWGDFLKGFFEGIFWKGSSLFTFFDLFRRDSFKKKVSYRMWSEGIFDGISRRDFLKESNL